MRLYFTPEFVRATHQRTDASSPFVRRAITLAGKHFRDADAVRAWREREMMRASRLNDEISELRAALDKAREASRAMAERRRAVIGDVLEALNISRMAAKLDGDHEDARELEELIDEVREVLR